MDEPGLGFRAHNVKGLPILVTGKVSSLEICTTFVVTVTSTVGVSFLVIRLPQISKLSEFVRK